MPTFPTNPAAGDPWSGFRKPGFPAPPGSVDPITTGGVGGGPRIASFTQQRPGGNLTLDALMAKQKEAAAAQNQALGTPQATIAGGLGSMLSSYLEGLKGYRAEQEEAAGREEITQAFTGIDPATGIATPEQLATVMRRDPDLGLALYQEAMAARKAAASQEHWVDIPNPPGTKEGVQWQQNTLTGEKAAKGGSAGVSIQNEPALQDWQSKDMGYWAQSSRSNDLLNEDDLDRELTGKGLYVLNELPEVIQRMGLTEKQKLANNAGLSFLAAVLRKESGASITAEDIATTGKIYLPQPGDTPDVIEQKRQMRAAKIQSLQTGVSGRPEFEGVRKEVETERASRAERRQQLSTPQPMPDRADNLTIGQVYKDETGTLARYRGGDHTREDAWEPLSIQGGQ